VDVSGGFPDRDDRLEYPVSGVIDCPGKEGADMKWERPDFVEIGMNAEIGGYQSDFGDGQPFGPHAPVLSSTSRTVTTDSATADAPRAS
jgi:hypothetical protein